MSTYDQEAARHAFIQEKAHAWQKRFDEALERVIANPESTRDEFLDVIWNQGILDRIAPLDTQEREARIENGSDIWKGSREDPELYLRIMYAIGMSDESARRGYTAGGGSYIAGIGEAIGFITAYPDRSARKRLFGDDAENFFPLLNQTMKDRAATATRKHGGVPHEPLIPWRAEGTYKEIPVIIDRYSGSGGLSLKAKSHDPKDHMRLGELTNLSPIAPTELNPDDFHVPEPPDHFEHELEIDGGRQANMSMRIFANILAEKYIREEYERDWISMFREATQGYDGQRIRLKMIFNKGKGISFLVSNK